MKFSFYYILYNLSFLTITLKKISKATGLPPHLLPKKKKKKKEFTQGLCGEKKNVGV